ncbi:MAG: peptide deformylase [Devosia sp.]|uniref:peptide deformylase n=1 Tax=Devosia sp. TaxID=1871048 RepID=UPI0024C6E7BC|nr:peptide deformylase [Devosia sp.]UYO00240.1 MAG: peptide deformylase [Devosia sp.]
MADSFVTFPDPVLTQRASPRPLDPDLRAVGGKLLAMGRQHQVYGLAAAHIGLVEPVVLVSLSEPQSRDYRLLYNPEIVDLGGATAPGTEGSVSMPGIEVTIVRHAEAEIAFDDADGTRQVLRLSGFAARVAQHEIDQMNGLFFLDRLSRLKRDTAIRRFRKLGSGAK